MKTSTLVILLAAIMTLGSLAQAQVESQTLSAEVDSEIDQMMVSSGAQSKPTQAVVTQTVVVPQQQVQKQPTTVVEASPLSDSRADAIRKNRQEEEMRTESRIVEKLEQSRMEDEKRRASVLFGDKFDSLQNGSQQPAQSQAQPQPVQVAPSSQVQPQPIIIEQKESLSRDVVREEIRAALEDQETAVTPMLEQKYFSAIAGISQVPDLQSIKGNYSLGAAFGTRFDYFMIEGGFVYSNYSILGARYVGYNNLVYAADFEMNQYQGYMAAKYQLLGGMVRPVIGGLAAYSYRSYNSTTATVYGASGTEFGKSHAIDLGIVAGVDFEFTEKMSLGVDMKYLFNMSSRIDGSTVSGSAIPEKQQYYITGLSARVNF